MKLLTRQSDRRQRRTTRPTGVNSSNHLENLHREGGKYELNKTEKPKVQRAKAEAKGELDPAAQKDSTVTKIVIIIAYANYNSVIVVQSTGAFCNAATTGMRCRHLCGRASGDEAKVACCECCVMRLVRSVVSVSCCL